MQGPGYLREDIVGELLRELPPKCFHCGHFYVKDDHYTKEDLTVWRPTCMCISNSGIRIVTGGKIEFNEESQYEEEYEEEYE
jgi:hypothetical protein